MVRQPTHPTVPSVILSKPMSRNRIEPGDLVVRKYDLNLAKFTKTGFVIRRENNGFLTVAWGNLIEEMWDDYDLMRLE